MKSNEAINVGTVLVAVCAEKAICGRTIIKEGSILKVAFDTPGYRSYVRVFRNKYEEQDADWRSIEKQNVRLATEEEIEMWNKEEYFVK